MMFLGQGFHKLDPEHTDRHTDLTERIVTRHLEEIAIKLKKNRRFVNRSGSMVGELCDVC